MGHSLGGGIGIDLVHLRPDLVGRPRRHRAEPGPLGRHRHVQIARQAEAEFVENWLRHASAGSRPVLARELAPRGPGRPAPHLRRTVRRAYAKHAPANAARGRAPTGSRVGGAVRAARDLDQLRSADVAYVKIPDAGHVPMEDNPTAFGASAGEALPLP